MKKKIQTSAEYLANLCLENGETHHGYTDDDLMNASLIFSHFLMDVIYTESRSVAPKYRLQLAKKTGGAIRELIKNACGKDMHKLAKSL